MSEDRVRRIMAWHERAYREDAQRTPFQVAYLGLHLTMHPDVQPITPMSDLLGRAVLDEVNATDRVLDMGTGCGVNAILAASTATDVVAVDSNPHAVACARKNAAANAVASRIDIRHSDLFTGVAGAFDLIIFDPPFRWLHPRNLREANMTDGNYATLTAFFAQVGEHLAPGAASCCSSVRRVTSPTCIILWSAADCGGNSSLRDTSTAMSSTSTTSRSG